MRKITWIIGFGFVVLGITACGQTKNIEEQSNILTLSGSQEEWSQVETTTAESSTYEEEVVGSEYEKEIIPIPKEWKKEKNLTYILVEQSDYPLYLTYQIKTGQTRWKLYSVQKNATRFSQEIASWQGNLNLKKKDKPVCAVQCVKERIIYLCVQRDEKFLVYALSMEEGTVKRLDISDVVDVQKYEIIHDMKATADGRLLFFIWKVTKKVKRELQDTVIYDVTREKVTAKQDYIYSEMMSIGQDGKLYYIGAGQNNLLVKKIGDDMLDSVITYDYAGGGAGYDGRTDIQGEKGATYLKDGIFVGDISEAQWRLEVPGSSYYRDDEPYYEGDYPTVVRYPFNEEGEDTNKEDFYRINDFIYVPGEENQFYTEIYYRYEEPRKWVWYHK